MAEATKTILGEIKLVGDLAGDGGSQLGSNPQLTHIVGLTPGQYNIANITVDTKGRITDIDGATSEQISALIPDATTSIKGKVKIGENIYTTPGATNGYQIADFNGTLITTTPLTYCADAEYKLSTMVDGTTIVVSGIGSAFGSTVQSLLDFINDSSPGFSVSLVEGNIKIQSDATGSSSTIEVDIYSVFSCLTGFVEMDTPVDGLSQCEIYVKDGSLTDAGVVQIGSGITVEDGVISTDIGLLTPATTSVLGGVIVPVSSNVEVDVAGNISVPIATSSTLGVVKVGSGLSVDGSGVLSFSSASLPVATETVLGCVKEGSGVTIQIDGTIDVDSTTFPTATTLVKGVVQVGSNINVSSGVISVADATTGVKGVVQVGSNIGVTSGVISVADATTSVKGVVQIGTGTGLSVSGGVLSGADATTAAKGVVQIGTGSGLSVSSGTLSGVTATTSVKGVVQVGTNIGVTSGVISVADATTGVKGVVQVGTNIGVTSGVISVADATTGVKGVVQIGTGSGLSVSSGVLSGVDATTSVKGVVQVGSNINVSSGVISVPTANGATAGIVSTNDSTNINIVAGNVSVGTNIPKKDTVNTFTKSQTVLQVNPTYTASWTPDLSLSNQQFMTLTGNVTLNNPSSLSNYVGGRFRFIIRQDATGNRTISYGANYKFPSGADTALSTAANIYDILFLEVVSSTEILCTLEKGWL